MEVVRDLLAAGKDMKVSVKLVYPEGVGKTFRPERNKCRVFHR